MKYYRMHFSCGIAHGVKENKYFGFSDSWTEEDIKWFFHEEATAFARKYSYLANFPNPEDYEYEDDYDDALEKIVQNWELKVENYSFFEEIDKEEWEDCNGEVIEQ